jgi:hypothetical protein
LIRERVLVLLAALLATALLSCGWIRNCGLQFDSTPSAAPSSEKEAVIAQVLRRALLEEKDIPDYGLLKGEDEVILFNRIGWGDSAKVLTGGGLPETDEVEFFLLSRDAMTELADCWSGDILYLYVDVISIDENEATVSLSMEWARSSRSTLLHLCGGGYVLLYRKQDGEWIFDRVVTSHIS